MLLFGNYMEVGAVAPVYQDVEDREKMQRNMNEYLDEFNSMSKKPSKY